MADLSPLGEALSQRRDQHLYRCRRQLDSPQAAEVVVDGRRCLNFSSNDYLGLANHPALVMALQQSAAEFGVGSGSSHLVCGHSREHQQLEQELAAFTGRDRALLFSTGYMANLAVITALLGKGDFVFEDRLNHASLLDGGLLSGARFQRFQHNDVADLERRLHKAGTGRKLIVVDAVFSMDGDLAPLPELATLAERYGAWLMADDAHGIGVLGDSGGGCAQHFGLDQQQLPVLMGTLGKSFGSFGAFVAGPEVLIETLIQFARPYIYTTGLPPAVAAASRAALALIRDDHQRRDHLQQLVSHFKRRAAELGLALMPSDTAVQPLLIGDSERAMAISAALGERGLLVVAIRPPTVPAGGARLRITLTASHSVEQLESLLAALAELMSEDGQ